MSEVLTFQVQARDPQKNKGTGTRVARRLREAGQVPAIVYGHKQDPQPISLTREDVWALIKGGSHLAQLKIGDATEMVLVRDVQWDHLGREILHMDFARVSADESIHTQVQLQVHGTPAGASEGGTLEVVVHTLDVTCRADAIPDTIRVDVSHLKVNEGIHVRDLKLPDGVQANDDADRLIVHVVTRSATAEVTATEGGPSEPEVIGRKAEDKEDKKEK